MACILINKKGDEITRYGFISHMEDYLKRLLEKPADTLPDEYLMSHGLDGETALSSLLKKTDPNDEESAILIRKETIVPNPEGGREFFKISYKVPRKNYLKKMRILYVNLFENHETDANLEECCAGGCGADGGALFGGGVTTTAADSGQYVQPLTTKKKKGDKGDESEAIIRRDMPGGLFEDNRKKTLIITEAQYQKLLNETEWSDFVANWMNNMYGNKNDANNNANNSNSDSNTDSTDGKTQTSTVSGEAKATEGMRASENGKNLIKQSEGLKLEAYQCSAGRWTIGYGHANGVNQGMKITQQQAEDFLNNDIITAENGVKNALSGTNVKLT